MRGDDDNVYVAMQENDLDDRGRLHLARLLQINTGSNSKKDQLQYVTGLPLFSVTSFCFK